jgi:hypothetical protein
LSFTELLAGSCCTSAALEVFSSPSTKSAESNLLLVSSRLSFLSLSIFSFVLSHWRKSGQVSFRRMVPITPFVVLLYGFRC